MLGLVTPEWAVRHVVGPGGGMCGIGIERSAPTAHFAIYGGKCPPSPKQTMDHLRETLNYHNQPRIELHAAEPR